MTYDEYRRALDDNANAFIAEAKCHATGLTLEQDFREHVERLVRERESIRRRFRVASQARRREIAAAGSEGKRMGE